MLRAGDLTLATRRRVPAERYDRDYLLSDNTEGFEEFEAGSLSFVKKLQLASLELGPGVSLLEVGFGRGEFLHHCARQGATVSGIDYSPAALEIGRETLADFPDADLRVADCRDLPFEDDAFDRVYSGDVLEHQDFEDGVLMLREMYRVLRPGGFLYLHTAPNTVFTRGVLPIAKPLLRLIDPNTVRVLEEHMKINETVHVHEYNLFSLRRAARRAGLPDPQVWIASDITRSGLRVVGALGRLAPVRFLLGNDLFLKSCKPAASA
jgi:ubiquinone/menaquinone biosynthesis C-methylase UbiE